jgi:outer membrane protein OmpA-like peptidoglycan-associated protein
MKSNYSYLILLVAFVIGCGGPPNNNPLLAEARTAVEAANNDPAIVAGAPGALDKAESTLRRGEALLKDGADEDDVYHYAYLTKQHVAIAEELTRARALEDEIKRGEGERQQVILEARELEAQRARGEAESERQKAEAERMQAESERERAETALERAAELNQRVQELEAQQTERGLVLTLGEVLFDVGGATLKGGGHRAIDQLANFLREYPERRVLIEGHTDNTGSQQLNLDLSRRRAEAVRNALTGMGISGGRIQTEGYGPSYPAASNDTAAGRQQNRRVEIIISDQEGAIPGRQ